MNFEKKGGGIALISKKRGILGWVTKTSNGGFMADLSGKQAKGNTEIFGDEEKAKIALLDMLNLSR